MLKSERLRQIAARVKQHAPMADIGSDHALLPCDLVLKERVPTAIAVEVNEGPYRAAQNQVITLGLSERIDVRFGDGLTVIKPGEVTTVVIAGMGGSLIVDILRRGQPVLDKTERLVLQPNVAAASLRHWLIESGWELIDEELVLENSHYYDILIAERGAPLAPYEAALSMTPTHFSFLLDAGPLLSYDRHPLLRHKGEQEIKKCQRILNQLTHSSHPATRKKRMELEKRIHDWKEMIACLPKEKTSFGSSNNSSHRI